MSSRSSLVSGEPLSLCPDRVSLKVYASCLRPDIEYKTVSVSYNTSSKELIWQLLSKFKMRHRDPKLFYLTLSVDVVVNKTGAAVTKSMVLDDEAKPAELYTCNPWGECKFSLQMRKGGLVKIYDSVLMKESQYKCLLISEDTTVKDVVRILLHCYGLEGFPVDKMSLYEHCKSQSYERRLNSDDRPLSVQNSWLDPSQFRLVLRKVPQLEHQRVGSFHQVGLPKVSPQSHGNPQAEARAMQAHLIQKFNRFCTNYQSHFYV